MENKGRGIFYGVIGVATLLVTIIGATFAYFSASINTAPNAISTASTELTLGIQPVVDGLKNDLIPVDETLEYFASTNYVGTTKCKDDNGNNMCSVFEFTVSNPSETTAQRIYGTLNVQTNTFPNNTGTVAAGTLDETMYEGKSNLAFAIFKGSASKNEITSYNVDGTAVTTVSDTLNNIIGTTGDMVMARTAVPSTTDLGDGETVSFDLTPLTQTLAPEGSVTYTIVMWLHETGMAQNGDQGKAFAAGLHFTTEGGGSGVTAVLSATGPSA